MSTRSASHPSTNSWGTLFIIATPIGNLDDISPRAIYHLKTVDIILAEDTRHSKTLLTALGINTPMQSLHDHNEEALCQKIILQLQQGRSYALISDAGTPLISDPGFILVKQARANQINVVPIPGPCAFVTALSATGIPCDMFTFVGFLPAQPTARRKKLQQLQTLSHTLIFYESTHRLLQTIKDINTVFGNNTSIVLAKELTKHFETVIEGTCESLCIWLMADPMRIKGEFVLILPPRPEEVDFSLAKKTLSKLLAVLPLRQAVILTHELIPIPKNTLYQLALEINGTS